MQQITIAWNDYVITTDKGMMKVHDIHKWLSERSYWCEHIPFEVVNTSFENSFCIGALVNDRQIAFARLVTDYATFGYLADVYVEEEYRGRGICKKMLQQLFDLDWVKSLRHLALATKDAHKVYEQIGFVPLKFPERYMQILRQEIYKNR